MSRMRSPSLVGHFKTLFGVGTLSGLGEGALLERFLAQRDETAFEEILARHGPMVLGICRRWLDDPHAVDDAFQAVFLILIRKAAALRDKNSLSSWLYGVSLRVAHRARTNGARRRSRERQDAEGLAMAQTPEHVPADRETLLILDEEIRRLPEKQQAAIVLCLVQGKTHEVAAAELSCPLGTVKSRLAGGRATLARRLSRRGLAPLVAVAMTLDAERLLAGCIPHDLARQTLEAALRFAISRSTRGTAVASSVQSLVDGVLSTMRFSRMKSIAMGVTAVGVLVCASTALVLARTGHQRNPAPPVPRHKVAAPESPPKLDLYGDPLPPGATMRFGTIRHRQEAPIFRIAFTRDDKFVVTDGDDGQLRVWDGHDGKFIRRIAVGIEALSDFALPSDGKTVATTGLNLVDGEGLVRQVVFNDLETGREVSRATWVENFTLPKVALDPDRQLLVTTPAKGELQMTSATTGVQTARLVLENEDVKSLAFSADRNRLAVVGSVTDSPSGTLHRLRVFDIKNASEFRSLAKFDVDGYFRDFAFSPDGTIIVGTDVFRLIFFDVASGARKEFVNTFIEKLAFSADGQRIVGVYAPDKLAFWNPIARSYVDLLNVTSRLAGALTFSNGRQTIAVNGGPNVLHIWDIASGRERFASTDAHENRVNSVAVTHDGKRLITASADRTVRLWNNVTGSQIKVLKHADEVSSISLSRDGRSLLVGMDFRPVIHVWDLGGDGPPVVLNASASVLALAYSDRDQFILAFSKDGNLRRWNSKDRRVQSEVSLKSLLEPFPSLPHMTEIFMTATFFAGGTKLAVVAVHSGLHVVDVESGKETGRVRNAILAVASLDKKTLAITRHGSNDTFKRMGNEDVTGETRSTSGTIVLVDSDTCHEKLQIEVAGSDVWALAFSPDGKTLAATSGWETGQIHLYEVATGREIRTINTPATRTPALAFSPDGSKLVCGMADTSVLVWDLQAKP